LQVLIFDMDMSLHYALENTEKVFKMVRGEGRLTPGAARELARVRDKQQ
jgi:hypothetical protein